MMISTTEVLDRLLAKEPSKRAKHFDTLSEHEKIAIADGISQSFKGLGDRFTIVEADLMIELAMWSKEFTLEFYEKYIYGKIKN